ncbi:unnamed protein product [Arctia plantaginis]|uniref:PHD-type domain-containing protein n=1 Tax=Arctia plantaginis TaxID=874455 RepID=A0A8S0ZTY5_ARCPL|nr:unnamed protein product [Arctia plantaginis]CAB3236174.1 unnamed protein product [Arctia plantaginis]
MSEIANNEGVSETEKPAQSDVKFPPFPDPTENDFDEDVSEEERTFYKNKFKDLNDVKHCRLHCTSCDRHMGCSARNERMRSHPLLRTLVCNSCHTFYNSGEFEKGDDGSELYCRWCGQGGQVYCCSDCPHVFCAKCIKRNLGVPKIKEIENADDWRCFKCNPECLRDLRAICWAVLRYCDLKNKITHLTEDPDLKAAYQKECALDLSECCKHKTNKRNQKLNDSLNKKKDVKKDTNAKLAATIISKMPATIQVKKFASVNPDDSIKVEKKAQKRPASPKLKTLLVKNPISIASSVIPKILTPVAGVPPLAKKIRLPTAINSVINSPIKFQNIRESKAMATYTRIRPKVTPHLPIPIANNCFNGYPPNLYHCNNQINDNINLSLESLTQGLDMAAVAALSNNNSQDDDVVCTPDFPLEPLCEVTEDNDDDVECITPGPIAVPKVTNPPPLVPRTTPNISDVTSENIIQMTENDVTVNESTGGLKFRVDPQTLSSNKMYRLPDGRIFAINANPNMPGGYSATIVAVTESNKTVPKGATFAAKLSSVSTSTPAKSNSNQVTRFVSAKQRNTLKVTKSTKTSETTTRECDLNVPVEWYRYNLIDAVDALEYSLSRLQKLKTEATSVYLRTRSVNEMRNLHRTLERLLNTSSSRFNEIRDNLNKGLKQYVLKKSGGGGTSEEDDDVEILPDIDDDPIFIDENSVESNMNGSENQEVDLTGPGSSEYNDSGENRNDNFSKGDRDPLNISGDSERGLILSIRHSTENLENTKRRNRKTSNSDDNKINGIESSRKYSDVKNAKSRDINKLTEEHQNADDTTIFRMTNDKADKQISNDDMNEFVSKMQDPADKVLDSDTKLEILEDKFHKSDKTHQDSDDRVQNIDDKIQDIVNKVQDSDHKQQSTDKILDVVISEEISNGKIKSPQGRLEDSNDKMEYSNGRIKESDSKTGDAKDTTQDSEDKTQDNDDKIQQSEISEELIETLLKDDSQDSATTNSEVPKPLSVT